MDEQQQQRVNQAAEEFADALRESYRAVSERGESAQELNAQLTEQFFNTVNDQLRTHAQDTRQMSEQLADHQQRGQEAAQQLTQESVQAYMAFINSMFSFSQTSSPEVAQRGTAEAQETSTTTTTTTTEASPERQADVEVPLEGYDSLNIEQITQRLDDLSTQEIRQLRAYEAENKSRSTLLRRLDERIEANSSSSSSSS
jgi:hypothetical protein